MMNGLKSEGEFMAKLEKKPLTPKPHFPAVMTARHPHGATEMTAPGPQIWVQATNPLGSYSHREYKQKALKS